MEHRPADDSQPGVTETEGPFPSKAAFGFRLGSDETFSDTELVELRQDLRDIKNGRRQAPGIDLEDPDGPDVELIV